ncbi:MAG: putative PEP-binding protein [Saprospiraceae bacterium]
MKKERLPNPNLHTGVCGEHSGDPASVEFFHNIGLDYVSCSPLSRTHRTISSTQAAIKESLHQPVELVDEVDAC